MDRKEHVLIQIDGTHLRNTNSALFQTTIEGRIADRNRKNDRHQSEKTKESVKGKGCMENCHVTQKKNKEKSYRRRK